MNTEVAAKFSAIIANVNAGQDMRDAFESQFGAGSFDKLAGMIYDDLRAPRSLPEGFRKGNAMSVVLGGRWSTARATRDQLVAALGAPTWEDEFGDKVKVRWVFSTPAGNAEVRDYWWNGEGEWTIAAENHNAAMLFAGFLRDLGIAVE
jgi:hypothetical protein